MTRTFHLNKLVRDGIVPSMEEQGQTVVSRQLSEDEKAPALQKKVIEEALEGELVDTYAALVAWAKAKGKTIEEVAQEATAKEEKIGGFSLGIYVETVTLNDDDPWGNYYAAEPERFPEG